MWISRMEVHLQERTFFIPYGWSSPSRIFIVSHFVVIVNSFFGFFTSNFVTYEQTVNFSGEITVFLSNLLTPPSVYAKIYFVGGHFGSAHFCVFSTNTNRLTTNAASRFFVYDYCVRQGKTSEKSDGVVTYSEDAESQF